MEDHLPGARSVPLAQIEEGSAHTIERGRPVIVYCWDGA